MITSASQLVRPFDDGDTVVSLLQTRVETRAEMSREKKRRLVVVINAGKSSKPALATLARVYDNNELPLPFEACFCPRFYAGLKQGHHGVTVIKRTNELRRAGNHAS
ncbi:hypothetical protein NDU88_001903 [Pleurodeles waltl]|uniref:Uncharacterized protein n=1 Tax=Pleurodeles waltl TaxID=8319 RepID=A0AAV7UW13_PLEWA|nr:hypothetical protein NDU88_001903 [Pleurodeles waltl]